MCGSNQNENKTKKRNYGCMFIFAGFVILVIFSVTGWWLSFLPHRGTFGDMFGSVNALFSGLALAGIIITLMMQSDELADQRKDMEKQNKILSQQRFESMFFSLLDMFREEALSIKYTDKKEAIEEKTKGKKYFKHYYKHLRDQKDSETAVKENIYKSMKNGPMSLQKHICTNNYVGEYTYYQLIQSIVVLIETKKPENKDHYYEILKTLLDAHAYLFLYYRVCYDEKYETLRKHLKEVTFFGDKKFMGGDGETMLFNPSHESLLDEAEQRDESNKT